MFLFLVLINDAGYEDQVNNAGDVITRRKKANYLKVIHMKYVDDLTLAEGVDMTTQLDTITLDERPQPDNYRARTGHKLKTEGSKVYEQLKEIQQYAVDNKMKLNLPKTKLMLFNPCKSKDFMPDFEIENTRIDLVEQTRLLGVVLTSNLSWSANTDSIVERCQKKMWTLRRLKKLGANKDDFIEIPIKQIRSIADLEVPVWNSSLTGEDEASLGKIQKTALNIILAEQYKSYTSSLNITALRKLSTRRRKICLKLEKWSQKHSKFTRWFKLNPRRTPMLKQTRF